jgi:hypothetical protein
MAFVSIFLGDHASVWCAYQRVFELLPALRKPRFPYAKLRGRYVGVGAGCVHAGLADPAAALERILALVVGLSITQLGACESDLLLKFLYLQFYLDIARTEEGGALLHAAAHADHDFFDDAVD